MTVTSVLASVVLFTLVATTLPMTAFYEFLPFSKYSAI